MISKRARAWIRRGTTIAVVGIVLVAVFGTWFTSQQIRSDLLEVDPIVLDYDVEVLRVGPESVRLAATPSSTAPGVWGLEWASGYARVGRVLAETPVAVDRELIEVRGRLEAGTLVGIDPFSYESDPGDAGLDFAEVLVEGPLGDYPAWQIDGPDDTWVIFVHGRGTYRREAVRSLGAVTDMGFTSLVVTYRNDPPAPESPNRMYSLGRHEWKDVEAAVEYAVASGAADIVLVGYDMGAATAAMLVRESDWAPRVVGLIFDAPLLDPGAGVDDDAAAKDVPGFIVGMAKGLVGLRFGVDWGRLDQVRHAEDLDLPILLLQGDADDVTPVRIADAFAESADEVTYRRIEGAGHDGVWNADPAGYEEAVRAFLSEVAAGPSDLEPVEEDLLEELVDDEEGLEGA